MDTKVRERRFDRIFSSRGKIKRLVFAISLIFIISSSIYAQGNSVRLTASVDSTIITIGDQVNLTIRIFRPEDASVQVPNLLDKLGDFEVVREYAPEVRETGMTFTEEIHRYLVTTYETGDVEIPSISVTYSRKGEEKSELNSDPIEIKVTPILTAESTDIRDIKGLFDLPRSYIWLIFIILFLLVAAAIVYYVNRRLKKRAKDLLASVPEEKVLIPKRPAHEIAYDELEKIRRMGLVEKGEIKLLYTLVSEVIRIYFCNRYHMMHTLELTTCELVGLMLEKQIKREHVDMGEQLLEESDLVKFARFIPEEAKIASLIDRAVEIVDATRLSAGGVMEDREVEVTAA